jgi:O-antigen/teichoic acid export membrane protein
MSRTKKFIYNTFTTALYQIVVMIVGFITPKVFLNAYGSETNGLVTSINQFITYFNLVEAGLAGAAVYALYKPLAEKNYSKINAIVSAAKKFYLKAGYIFVGLIIAMALIYPIFVKTGVLSTFEVGLLVLVLGANGVIEFFTLSKYRVLLTASQKTYIISLSSIIYVILNTIITIVLAQFKVNIIILKTVAILAILVRSFILMTYVKKKYKYISYKEKPDYQSMNKRWDALFLQVLTAIQNGAAVVITTIFTNLTTVSVYSIYNMVMHGVNGVLQIFTTGLSASFGDVIARKEENTLKKSYREFEFSYYSIITVVYSVSMVMLLPFVKIYTTGITDANYILPLISFLMVLNGLLYNIKTPQGMLVISAGLYKETRIQTITQALIIVVLGVILTPIFGLAGVLIASCISNLYRDIDLIFYIPKNVTKIPVVETLRRIGILILNIVIIVVPCMLLINIKADSYFQWAIYAIGITIYAIMVVIINALLFDKEQLKSVLIRIKSMFLHKKVKEK